jgi:hypothetical protein
MNISYFQNFDQGLHLTELMQFMRLTGNSENLYFKLFFSPYPVAILDFLQ